MLLLQQLVMTREAYMLLLINKGGGFVLLAVWLR